jgi:hypothetical protein
LSVITSLKALNGRPTYITWQGEDPPEEPAASYWHPGVVENAQPTGQRSSPAHPRSVTHGPRGESRIAGPCVTAEARFVEPAVPGEPHPIEPGIPREARPTGARRLARSSSRRTRIRPATGRACSAIPGCGGEPTIGACAVIFLPWSAAKMLVSAVQTAWC